MKTRTHYLLALLALAFLPGCEQKSTGDTPGKNIPGNAIRIISGSENKILEPILQEWSKKSGVPVAVDYRGSVEIMQALQGENEYDAAWPANSLWIDLSGNKAVRHASSITRTPVVIAIKQSKAKELGLKGPMLKIADLVRLARDKKLRLLMSNPTQSNSGAMGYFGFLHSLNGKEDALTSKDLDNPALREQAKTLLSAITRSSNSSGWIKDLYVQDPDSFDAMVNYEALVIEANQELTAKNREPLLVFYPSEGQPIADSPLAFISKPSNASKEQPFLSLQQHLLSPEVQARLLQSGRRTGLVGAEASGEAFKKEWGILPDKILQPIPLPDPETIRKAIDVYLTALKKPSLTVFVIDFSGSMAGQGEAQTKKAVEMLFTDEAKRHFLQAGPSDITVIVPFDNNPRASLRANGADPAELAKVVGFVNQNRAGGGTDIYGGAMEGLRQITRIPDRDKYQTSVVLMTDGVSDGSFEELKAAWQQSGSNIPIFPIMFGNADPSQLQQIADLTRSKVFDGRKNMVDAFKNAKSFN
ncbi:MAG: substrate-binding and VWA domain-containing protein [Verrucomicrobiae bacterium]|nr:substrate-binding and VWA domain-containing protein [Verrucomicrobiae bacterium]